jgi:hypothetical protein
LVFKKKGGMIGYGAAIIRVWEAHLLKTEEIV